MKTRILQFAILIVLLLSSSAVIGQSTTDNNTPFAGKFLGYDAAGIDLDFKTNNINRMKLMQTSTDNVDGFNITNSGFLGLSMDPTWLAQDEPYSLLHLNGEFNSYSGPTSQEFGYRDWMRPGITFTHNGDLMYIGPKRNAQDITDAVISWSDNATSQSIGPDVLRFLFTDRNETTSISSNPMYARDYDGVEVARMTGDAKMGVGPMWTNTYLPQRALDVIRRNDALPQFRITHSRSTSVDWGINADFQVSTHGHLHIVPRRDNKVQTVAIGFFDDPTDITDPKINTILDVGGLTRIRELKDNNPSTLIMGYHFEDVNVGEDDHFLGRLDFPTEDPECHVLNGQGEWLDICDGLGGQDCRWEDIGSGTVGGELDMRMGFDPLADCYRGKVSIGAELLKNAKLEVQSSFIRDNIRTAVIADARGDQNYTPDIITGILGRSNGIQSETNLLNTYIGVSGTAGAEYDGKYNVGVKGEGSGVINGSAIGVYAKALSTYGQEIGVYSEGHTALFMAGGYVMSGSPILLSDESIKTDVNEIENATDLLSQMQPKSYLMQNPENRDLHLDEGVQYGFIAQEMNEVFPDIVKDVVVPEKMDSTGFVEGTSIPLKGINYVSIIPVLVAGFQEQNTTLSDQAALIASQNETIAALEAQLEAQASQIAEMQSNMESVLDAVEQIQQKTNNCCTQKNEDSKTESLFNDDEKQLNLEQNVPNPFDSQTKIAFNLPNEAQVILEITDAAGRPLVRLINGQMSSGEHTTLWDGSNMASGIYFYTLYADGELITKKMIKK